MFHKSSNMNGWTQGWLPCIALALLLVPNGLAQQMPCIPRYFNDTSFTCVCNATYCDTFPGPEVPDVGSYLLVTSDISQFRFEQTLASFSSAAEHGPNRADGVAEFQLTDVEKQTILGFGGAVTDSAALNVLSLNPATQDQLLRSYYTASGLEYTINRINIGGCDFSSRGYTYVDTVGDVELQTFALQEEDLDQKIPVLHRIFAMSPNPVITIAAAWTAPSWMKTNNDLIGFGQLLEEYYPAWAEYHIKFLDAYASHNITIWGMSAQNEPLDGYIPGFSFNCMGWTPEQQRKFIAENLGPLLVEKGYADLKLMAMDDQRTDLPRWVEVIMNDTTAAQYVSGVAVHWYVDYVSPDRLTETHDLFPDKFILYTEACEGDGPAEVSVRPGSWRRLETYARDIIEDLEHWVVGWVDWNIALDMQGGPNWCLNYVDSPILVDAEKDEFYKNPMYYAMGHFSKFIRPGAVHLDLVAVNGSQGIDTTAFRNVDDTVAIVVFNDQEMDIPVQISTNTGLISMTSLARSITSILYRQ